MAEGTTRLLFVDRLRALAVVVMIEVHVVNALLDSRLRVGPGFRALDAINGLVAPSFLLCAGFGLARTFARPWRSGEGFRPVLVKHLVRCGMLLALGYALHASSLVGLVRGTQDLRGRADAVASFLQADILQVIAIALAAIAAIAAGARDARRFAAIAIALGTATIVATPLVRAWADGAALPGAIAPYLTEGVPTQFPLLPWLAYPCFGAALGAQNVAPSARPSDWARVFRIAAMSSLGAAAAVACLPAGFFPPHDAWSAGPVVAFARTGAVCLVGAVLARGAADTAHPLEKRTLLVLGQHSLLVYLAHVALVYGRNPVSLRSLIGPRLGYASCLGVWLAVTLAMVALSNARNRIARSPVRSPREV